MNVIKILYFYSTWGFILFCLDLLGVLKIDKSNISTMIIIIFTVAMLLNIYYFTRYTLKQNLIRLPYEIIIHFLPLFIILNSRYPIKLQDMNSYKLFIASVVFYIFIYGQNAIQYYSDPLNYFKSNFG